MPSLRHSLPHIFNRGGSTPLLQRYYYVDATMHRRSPPPPPAFASHLFSELLHLDPQHPLLLPPLLLAPSPFQAACFDADCQSKKDLIFLVSILSPMLAFLAASTLAFKSKPPLSDPDNNNNNRNTSETSEEEPPYFEDKDTGIIFQSSRQGTVPARDRFGELSYRPISYTPWPVEASALEKESCESIRIPVGPIGATQPRSFIFDRILPQPSVMIVVTLPRPLGIIFEEDVRHGGRAVVVDIVPGGSADRLTKKASLSPTVLAKTSPKVGDVLRACTCTNVVYKTAALMFGAQTPERVVVVFGADQQRWPDVATALKRGLVADGEVTLVLERQLVEERWGET